MKEKYLSYKDVVKLLLEYSDCGIQKELFVGGKLIKGDFIKPGHGSCCTCQICGHHHDDCICYHNEFVDIFEKLDWKEF